jgi:hypothetical protein
VRSREIERITASGILRILPRGVNAGTTERHHQIAVLKCKRPRPILNRLDRKELAKEGQSLEAEAIAGIEGISDPDVAEVCTKELPEDDVPTEYDQQD